MVDNTRKCLRGEDARQLLEACGAVRHLRPVDAPDALTPGERSDLRKKAGHEQTSWVNDEVDDRSILGLKKLTALLPDLSPEERVRRAGLIWDALYDFADRYGKGVFKGEYSWTHHGHYKAEFPSAFVRHLNKTAWVPDAGGKLQQPELVLFDKLGWKYDPFLLENIKFKSPAIEKLAQEAGFDPDILLFLRERGINSLEKLKHNLKADALPPGDDKGGANVTGIGNQGSNQVGRGPQGGHNAHEINSGAGDSREAFISYIQVGKGDKVPDPDGLSHKQRMDIEAQAIDLIIKREPQLHKTETNNPGFDLYETDDRGNIVRWIEVKSMTGGLNDHPVGLTRAQFDCAREKGDAYWLYIVEYATKKHQKASRILKIQNPAGRARTFTFDHGWAEIAEK